MGLEAGFITGTGVASACLASTARFKGSKHSSDLHAGATASIWSRPAMRALSSASCLYRPARP